MTNEWIFKEIKFWLTLKEKKISSYESSPRTKWNLLRAGELLISRSFQEENSGGELGSSIGNMDQGPCCTPISHARETCSQLRWLVPISSPSNILRIIYFDFHLDMEKKSLKYYITKLQLLPCQPQVWKLISFLSILHFNTMNNYSKEKFVFSCALRTYVTFVSNYIQNCVMCGKFYHCHSPLGYCYL